MKKFIRNCICIILVLVLISFLIPPLKTKAGKTINISGKVTIKNKGVGNITVELLKEDGKTTEKATTTADGNYTFKGIDAETRKKLQTKI